MAMAAHKQFMEEFRNGRRLFGESRFPIVVVTDDGSHVCADSCVVLPVGYTPNKSNVSGDSVLRFILGGRSAQCEKVLFVCVGTLKAHVCGEDLCTGAYVVGPHGRTCLLTGQLVGTDGSNLSHGWREDPGRKNWEGASVRAGVAAYGERFRPGDEGYAAPRSKKRPRPRPCQAPPTAAWIVSPAALDSCARRLRELFPGSSTRLRLDKMQKCAGATKAVVAIERYLRVARNANQPIYLPTIDAIFYRFCSQHQKPTVAPLDDVEAHILALGYCAVAAQFLQVLVPAPAVVSACPFVVLVAFLYLQRQGVQAQSRVLVDRDALLCVLLPAANSIDKFGVSKGAFTAAKNRIQLSLRACARCDGRAPRTGGHTVAQLLREGAALGAAIDRAAGEL